MALRNILKEGDDTLAKVCRRVENFDDRLHTLLDDMAETMKGAQGVGLAASQVGVLRRVVTINTGDGLIELVNPEIIEQKGRQEEAEGCLSFPGEYYVTRRPYRVKVRAQDRNGNTFETVGEGLKARAFCHEIDHLDGITFKDRRITQSRISRKKVTG